MYKRMLVPLDGSELGGVVLPYAKELAGRLDLDIIFLHVCSPEQKPFIAMHRAYIEQMADMVKHQSREVQQKSGMQTGDKPVETRSELIVGYPAEEILRYSDKNGIDFILIATHGYSGLMRWTIGSVADKVLRASKVPVWLVRAGISDEIVYDRWPRRTILVPLDGSEFAESVIPHVEALAKQRGAELVDIVLLRVIETPFITADYPFPDWEEHVERMNNHFKQISAEYLVGVEKRLKDADLSVRSEVIMGKPADEIINYASKNPFNLIVMSTHGLSGLTRWAYGSVADRVLRGVSDPIFLVRPR